MARLLAQRGARRQLPANCRPRKGSCEVTKADNERSSSLGRRTTRQQNSVSSLLRDGLERGLPLR